MVPGVKLRLAPLSSKHTTFANKGDVLEAARSRRFLWNGIAGSFAQRAPLKPRPISGRAVPEGHSLVGERRKSTFNRIGGDGGAADDFCAGNDIEELKEKIPGVPA